MSIAKGSKSTLVIAEELAYGTIPANTPATGTLTLSGQPADADTVTVGGKVYRFKTTMAAINDVFIDSTQALTATNLFKAINAGTGAGTKYYTGTTANANVTATNPSASVVVVSAIVGGVVTSVTATKSGTNLTWTGLSGGFLSGGTGAPYALRTTSFVSETLDETINKLQSAEIKSNRQVPNIRGGNISTGGGFTTDFCIPKSLVLLKHLLAPSSVVITQAVPTLLANGTLARGEYYYTSIGSNVYLVIAGGAYTGGANGPDDSLGASAASVTVGGCTFQYVGNNAVVITKYELQGGVSFPTGGLVVEKQILGAAAGLYVAFAGCRVDSLDLTIGQEAITQAAWTMLGLRSYTGAASQFLGTTTVNSVTGEAVNGFQAFVAFGTSAVNRPIKDASLNIKNGIDPSVFVIGSRYRREVPEGTREASGRLTVYYEDSTEYDAFKNETVEDLLISFNNHGEFILFEMPEVKLTGSGTPKISGQGVLEASYDFTAFNNTGTGDIKVTAYCLTTGLSVIT